jgi:hypothetical protein
MSMDVSRSDDLMDLVARLVKSPKHPDGILDTPFGLSVDEIQSENVANLLRPYARAQAADAAIRPRGSEVSK